MSRIALMSDVSRPTNLLGPDVQPEDLVEAVFVALCSYNGVLPLCDGDRDFDDLNLMERAQFKLLVDEILIVKRRHDMHAPPMNNSKTA